MTQAPLSGGSWGDLALQSSVVESSILASNLGRGDVLGALTVSSCLSPSFLPANLFSQSPCELVLAWPDWGVIPGMTRGMSEQVVVGRW